MKDLLDERAITLGKYLIKNKATIRQTAAVFEISKSTVHHDLSTRLKKVNPRLYRKVKKVLDNNFAVKHLRGGRATFLHFKKNKI